MKACVMVRRAGGPSGSLGPRLRNRLEKESKGGLISAFETYGEADAVGFLDADDLASLDETVKAIEGLDGVASVEVLPELEVA